MQETSNPDNSAMRAAAPSELSNQPGPQGVGGWLLFLCIVLTIISPLRGLFNLFTGYNESSRLFDQFPGVKVITLIDFPLSLGVIAMSIHAGLALWRIRPGAVQTARRFLYITLGYSAIASILPFMAGLPTEAHGVMVSEVVKNTAQGLGFVAIWLAYLAKSKRVRATFPDAA